MLRIELLLPGEGKLVLATLKVEVALVEINGTVGARLEFIPDEGLIAVATDVEGASQHQTSEQSGVLSLRLSGLCA